MKRTFVQRGPRSVPGVRPGMARTEKHSTPSTSSSEAWCDPPRRVDRDDKQGFLGPEIEDEYGGFAAADDYRFNAVRRGELSPCLSGSPPSGHPRDIVAPYLRDLCTEEQQRWLPAFCTGELVTAIGMTEPSGGRISRR